jgi:methionyl-tRNA formyltransferase
MSPRVLFVTETDEGRYVLRAINRAGYWPYLASDDHGRLYRRWAEVRPELVIVCGWRRLIPGELIASVPLGVVGFHSAKLPEDPGRAPVHWAILRGDKWTADTMLFLDEGIDSGDIIDQRVIPLNGWETPEAIYASMAHASAEMLLQHLPALLRGAAPRTPQDTSRRGPLTTKEGWNLLAERSRLMGGHG